MNPELYRLVDVPWQFFATLTFARERVPARFRKSMVFALLRKQSRVWGVHFKQVLWFLRPENGESTGRFHYHMLIGGFPPSAVTPRNCLAIASQWEGFGGGMARVREYVGAFDGAAYVLKDLEQSRSVASLSAMDNYEVSKFGTACELMLSESVVRLIRARIARAVRETARQTPRKIDE